MLCAKKGICSKEYIMNNAIELCHLKKTYKKGSTETFKAVDDITLTIKQGQLFGFLGPNGAGKTTTIKMICSLVSPSSGTVSINGFDTIKQHGKCMQQIGAVLEGTRNIYWQLSPWENLLYFGRLKGIHTKHLIKRAEYLLNEFKLWQRKDDNVGSFSRGMQQKVAIACALIADPPIILLDEPTLGLDVQASRTVKRIITNLVKNEGKTVVLTTHQLDVAEQLCDRIAIIRGGKIVTDKPTKELLHLFKEESYCVSIRGHLTQQQKKSFTACTIKEKEEKTTLHCSVSEPQQLYNLLDTIRNLDVPLRSITKEKHSLEKVFVRLVQHKGEQS